MIASYSSPTVICHATAEEIWREFWSLSGPFSDLDEIDRDTINSMTRMGLWGYMDTRRDVLHYWWDGSEHSQARMLELMAHELGHYIKRKRPSLSFRVDRNQSRSDRRALNEEVRADSYAWVAVTAAKLVQVATAGRTREEAQEQVRRVCPPFECDEARQSRLAEENDVLRARVAELERDIREELGAHL